MRKIKKGGLNKWAEMGLPVVIFLVLNLAFFVTMLLFVQRTSSHALVYEEAYSKKIGLMLNRAEKGMQFELDITDLIKIALKNGVTAENINEIINIDTDKGLVTVRAKPEGGFTFPYFSKINLKNKEGNPNDLVTTKIIQTIDKDKKITGGRYFIKIE
jgi:hypothetical protein